jgi:protein SCO1
MRRSFALLVALAFAASLAACGEQKPQFKSTDITGAGFGTELRLTDHNGKPRSLADFNGKAVVLFFGYTHCPDVCPTTLADIAGALRMLGPDAAKVQVLFVTADPERDTPELLAKYLPSFDPSFLGLTGSPEEIAKAAKEFKVFYQKQPGKTPETYTVDHSAGTFVFDPQGRLRLYVPYGKGADVFAHDLSILLGRKG